MATGKELMRHLGTATFGFILSCAIGAGAAAQDAQQALPRQATAANAAASGIVVELFTSQGCVSCPPADQFFAELAKDSRIIPLSLHVDYWDYIGWKDSFGNPAFTGRQKAYAKAVGSRTIYTPQFVIGGIDRIEGFDPLDISEALIRQTTAAPQVLLQASRDGDALTISAQAQPLLRVPVKVELVRYIPQETVEIPSGENAGQSITYYNVVTAWVTIADWSGQEPLSITTSITGAQPAVVIVQEVGPAAILAAARID